MECLSHPNVETAHLNSWIHEVRAQFAMVVGLRLTDPSLETEVELGPYASTEHNWKYKCIRRVITDQLNKANEALKSDNWPKIFQKLDFKTEYQIFLAVTFSDSNHFDFLKRTQYRLMECLCHPNVIWIVKSKRFVQDISLLWWLDFDLQILAWTQK